MVEEESKAIHWTSAANVLINQGYAGLDQKTFEAEPAIGLLLNLLHRAFEHVEAALVAFVTGSGAPSEGLSRLAMEASMTIKYILAGNRESRMLAFLYDYPRGEEKRLENWRRATEKLPIQEQESHIRAIALREDGVRAIRAIVDKVRSEFLAVGKEIVDEKWPNVASRSDFVGDTTGHRTIYGRMSGQIHSDAEETIRYLMGKVSEDEKLFERMALETIWFTRFMMYFGVKYFVEASCAFARVYRLSDEYRQLERGLQVLGHELALISEHVGGSFGSTA